jgi:hypothetical protein
MIYTFSFINFVFKRRICKNHLEQDLIMTSAKQTIMKKEASIMCVMTVLLISLLLTGCAKYVAIDAPAEELANVPEEIIAKDSILTEEPAQTETTPQKATTPETETVPVKKVSKYTRQLRMQLYVESGVRHFRKDAHKSLPVQMLRQD